MSNSRFFYKALKFYLYGYPQITNSDTDKFAFDFLLKFNFFIEKHTVLIFDLLLIYVSLSYDFYLLIGGGLAKLNFQLLQAVKVNMLKSGTGCPLS